MVSNLPSTCSSAIWTFPQVYVLEWLTQKGSIDLHSSLSLVPRLSPRQVAESWVGPENKATIAHK